MHALQNSQHQGSKNDLPTPRSRMKLGYLDQSGLVMRRERYLDIEARLAHTMKPSNEICASKGFAACMHLTCWIGGCKLGISPQAGLLRNSYATRSPKHLFWTFPTASALGRGSRKPSISSHHNKFHKLTFEARPPVGDTNPFLHSCQYTQITQISVPNKKKSKAALSSRMAIKSLTLQR